jgi:hypothetical protein
MIRAVFCSLAFCMLYTNKIDSFNKKPRFEANKQETPILFKNLTFVTGTFIVTCQDDVVKEIDFAVVLI